MLGSTNICIWGKKDLLVFQSLEKHDKKTVKNMDLSK